MNNEIINLFSKLKITGQRSAISIEDKREKDLRLIAYLKSIIGKNSVTDFEDIGFCYWNISDNYALLRNGHSLCENHKKFYDHIIKSDSCYLYWLVCDATQRLALEKDGYHSFWWDLYREAVEQNPNSKHHFAEFNAHRAALYSGNRAPTSQDAFNFAVQNYEKFLAKTESASENLFYHIIYLSLVSKSLDIDNNKLCHLSYMLFEYLSLPRSSDDFLVGEWKSFITPFDKKKQAVIGITSAINALIYSNDMKMVKSLYAEACNMGLPKNHYIERRLNEN
ncbi:MAG: hypothetical protein E7608_02555 [Ruminococcaceae bacterium]|nr:hypothetical protein [Oscillospiraceae bacterium]